MTNSNKWTAEDIPDQAGKVVIVTGGNSGLGFETVRKLADKRARVVLACRDTGKGDAAREKICQGFPGAEIKVMQLDLASLASIRQFAGEVKDSHDRLHILVNNAGVMATPYLKTADGFELQIGTNHLGHFALTGLLLDPLLGTPGSRVVTVSSFASYLGRINLEDLMSEKSYERWRAYGQSKLANLLFTYELQRKLEAAGASTSSVAAHPGASASNLRTQLISRETPIIHRVQGYFWEMVVQKVEMGALPQLNAATAPGVKGGEFYGPDGFMGRTGYPKAIRSPGRSYDVALARRLWEVSVQLTEIDYAKLGGVS